MNRLSTKLKVSVTLVATLVLHAAAIEGQRYVRGIEPEFKQGSADDMLADSLNSGDVILFNRRWYTYHIPTALLVRAQKAWLGGEYDHSGVIVMKFGTPYILEKTPLNGIQCKKFEDRIRESSASTITVLKLDRAKELSSTQAQALKEYATNEATTKNSFANSELVGFAGGFVQYIFSKKLGGGKSDAYCCTNTELVAKALDSMNLKLEHAERRDQHDITLEDIHKREVVLKSETCCITFERDDVHVRS